MKVASSEAPWCSRRPPCARCVATFRRGTFQGTPGCVDEKLTDLRRGRAFGRRGGTR